jgi:hypothetical protein
MNCDYLFISDDRTPALTKLGGDCIPNLEILWLNDLNSVRSGLSELREFHFVSIHIKGYIITTILRITKNFEEGLFVFL